MPCLVKPLLVLGFNYTSLSTCFCLGECITSEGFTLMNKLLCTFSKFSVCGIFFFRFRRPVVVFPLLLTTLSTFVCSKGEVIFALTMFSTYIIGCCFFIKRILFMVVCFLVVALAGACGFGIGGFLLLTLRIVVKFLTATFVLLPSILKLVKGPELTRLPGN